MLSLLEPGLLEAFGLYLVRTSALLLAAPLLGLGSGFSGYKIGLVLSVSFLLFSATGEPLQWNGGAGIEPMEYTLLALREVLIGVFLAFTLHLAMLALSVAGQLIGHEMGFNMSNMVDPVSGVNTPLISHLYEVLFFLALLSVNGHHWILRALGGSFERAPIGSINIGDSMPEVVLNLFRETFAAGLTFAAPVMILLALVSMLMGLLARVVPQLNVLEVGFTLRIGVALGAMFMFSPLLAPAMDHVFEQLMTGLDAGLDAIGS